jgi:hypothetical protein
MRQRVVTIIRSSCGRSGENAPPPDFLPQGSLDDRRVARAPAVRVHIIFPAFTIGLSAFIATLLILWRRSGREHYHRGAACRDLAAS